MNIAVVNSAVLNSATANLVVVSRAAVIRLVVNRVAPYIGRVRLGLVRQRLGYLTGLIALSLTLASASPAHASGSSMPWETPLNQILESVQGPVAKIMSVIIITMTGLTLAFGDTSGGFRRLIQIVFGLSIAFAASSFFLSFFSFSGGALI
jgi:type IV secretory pathway VirB2 component (pilin)